MYLRVLRYHPFHLLVPLLAPLCPNFVKLCPTPLNLFLCSEDGFIGKRFITPPHLIRRNRRRGCKCNNPFPISPSVVVTTALVALDKVPSFVSLIDLYKVRAHVPCVELLSSPAHAARSFSVSFFGAVTNLLLFFLFATAPRHSPPPYSPPSHGWS